MLKTTFSGMMAALLLAGMLTLAFNIQAVEAYEYYNFKITVTPESPTTLDEINVTVSFDLASISMQATFGSISQVGNEFSVYIIIYVPECCLPALLHVEHTYSLGKLPAGSYSFTATMYDNQYSESFTVSPPPYPLSVNTFKNDVPITSNMTLLDENRTMIQTVNGVSAYDWLLPSGTYYVQASIFYNGFAYTSEQTQVDLTNDTKLAINLQFGNLTVSCLDVENRPLKNCTVVFVRQGEERVGYTDDSGSASLEAYYGNWTVKAYWMNVLVGEANITMNQPEANLSLRCNVGDSTLTQNIAPVISGIIAGIVLGSFSVWAITKRKRQTAKQ
jgi:hypothetical protein